MPFLAFDTSTERLSIAVTDDQQTWSFEGEGGAQASAQLIERALDLLKQAGLTLHDLDAVVFGRGPGSFTGLRTSCAVAQGLALGAERPVLALDSLLAVAEEARYQHGHTQILAALDARMDEVYAAAYQYQQGQWQAVALGGAREPAFELCRPEHLTPPALQAVGAPWMLAGTAGAAYGARFEQLAGQVQCPGHAVWPSATALLRLAPQAWAAGLAVSPESAQPLYLRDKVAQTTQERAAEKAQKPPKTPTVARSEAQLLRMTTGWLDKVMTIEKEVYSHPWSRGNFEDSLRTGYDLMVLVGGETLIAYFVAMKGVGETHLLNITVAPAFQRQGWGRLLLDAVALLARRQGAAKLWLEVRASNERAQAVYRRVGFEPAGVRKAYYAAPVAPATPIGREDAVVMGLELTA